MKEYLAHVLRGGRLSEQSAAEAMGLIMDGHATPAQIGGLLAGLAVRGESEDEVVGFARVMRERAAPLQAPGTLDTCGTGGDGAGTFNISTAASLVVAACGVRVAKHGNRSQSGRCGSADVLEALGVRIDAAPAQVERDLAELGWAFLFAPAFHASTRHAVAPRRELGVPTAFNLLGPLTNPAHPVAQVVGVPAPERTEFLARCLARLGVRRAWVVHGTGLDEVSLAGPTQVAALENGEVRGFTLRPEDVGLPVCPVAALHGGDAAANAALIERLLGGECGPPRDVVLLNAAAALVVAERAANLREGVAQAAAAIDAGHARRLLHALRTRASATGGGGFGGAKSPAQ